MNKAVLDMLRDRLDSRRGGNRDRRDYERDRRDYEGDGRDNRNNDYRNDYDERNYDEAMRRDMRDMRDYGHSKIRLTKADMREWKQMMENVDGTRGPHYDMQQIMSAADKLGVKFEEFTEPEFCIAVNMMYSDYCKTLKKYMSSDKMLECCAELAMDFLCDPDGPEAHEKLLMYYHCIVNA